MFRFLAAGDARGFTYAGQVGLHVRPVEGLLAPGAPDGNEVLFGFAAGPQNVLLSSWLGSDRRAGVFWRDRLFDLSTDRPDSRG